MPNPYTSGPYPYRVNAQIHAHTTESDGAFSPSTLVSKYAGEAYDALAITDHDELTTQPSGVAYQIRGDEYTLPSQFHILALDTDVLRGTETDPQACLDLIANDGGTAVVAHPNWKGDPIILPKLLGLSGYAGIEIYNAHVVPLNPQYSGLAIGLWDQILRTRRDCWGFATDDFHAGTSREVWDMGRLIVFPTAETVASVMQAIQRGDFVADVANDGVTLNPPVIGGSPETISLNCPGATRVRFVTELGPGPWIAGDEAEYEVGGCEWYVRPEVQGAVSYDFDTLPALRWGVHTGTWGVSSGVLEQSSDSDQEYQIFHRAHLTSDWTLTADVKLPSNGQQEQAGLLFNLIDHNHHYYLSLRKASPSAANTLQFWEKDGGWTALVTVPFTPQTNVWYRMKVQYDAASATFTCTCWLRDDPEPSPQIVTTHGRYRHGAVGLRSRRKASFDNVTIEGFTSYYQPIAIRA